MRPLSASEIVQVWEWGQEKHAVDRALALLALAYPEQTHEQLQRLTIGQRNSRLLALRERTFGPLLKGLAVCAECGAALEFSVAVNAIRQAEPVAQEFSLQADDLTLRFRLLNSLDLATIVGLEDASQARLRLIEHCLLDASRAGQPLAAAELPDFVQAALADALSERDSAAELHFQLTCAECGHQWSAIFDIVSFYWTELCARAKRLLSEVDTLARAYGWRETEILALSEKRRHFYLECNA
jgi:hypothetical protein